MLILPINLQFADAAQNDNTPANNATPERMQALVQSIARTTGGRAMLDHITIETRMSRLVLRSFFNPQETGRHGAAYNGALHSDIFLDARLHDDLLSSILFHELRHATQPRNNDTNDLKLSLPNRLLYSRLIEGDAFTHQICFGLDLITQASCNTQHLQNMQYFSKFLASEPLAALKSLNAAYLTAENAFDKKDAMHGMYWLLQEHLLGGYDTRNIKKFNEFAETLFLQNIQFGGNMDTANPREKQRLFERHAERLLQKPVFAAGNLPYIGNNAADIVARILATYSPETIAAVKATHDAFDNMANSRTPVPGIYYKPQKFS